MTRYFIVGLVVCWGSLVGAVEPVSVSVYPRVTATRSTSYLNIHVEPNSQNRWLVWQVDGPEYFRGSTRQLDGASAPRNWTFALTNLPEGDYTVSVIVSRSDESESLAEARIRVLSGGSTKPPR